MLQAAEAFTIALQLAPGLVQAKEQLDLLGIKDAKIRVEDAGLPDDLPDAGPDAG